MAAATPLHTPLLMRERHPYAAMLLMLMPCRYYDAAAAHAVMPCHLLFFMTRSAHSRVTATVRRVTIFRRAILRRRRFDDVIFAMLYFHATLDVI